MQHFSRTAVRAQRWGRWLSRAGDAVRARTGLAACPCRQAATRPNRVRPPFRERACRVRVRAVASSTRGVTTDIIVISPSVTRKVPPQNALNIRLFVGA